MDTLFGILCKRISYLIKLFFVKIKFSFFSFYLLQPGLFSGTIVIFATKYLTEYFTYIPKACLGSVIICAVINMVDVAVVHSIWKVNRIDIIPYTVWSILFIYIDFFKKALTYSNHYNNIAI